MYFKKIGLVMLASVFLLSGCTVDVGSSMNVADMKLFSDPGLGVSMSYPSTWKLDQSNAAVLVNFSSPAESKLDPFKENVSIGFDTFPPEEVVDAQKFAQTNLQVLKEMTDYKEVSGGFVTRGSHEMYREEFTAKLEIETGRVLLLQWVQYYLVKDGVGYRITFTALPETTGRFLPTVDQMVSTFTVK